MYPMKHDSTRLYFRSIARPALLAPVLILLLVSLMATGCVVQPVDAQEAADYYVVGVPTIAIAPIAGTPGTSIFVSGAGWLPSEVVYVNLELIPDGEVIQATVAIVTTDDEGKFNAAFVYPLDPIWGDPGEVGVVASSVEAGREATAIFQVVEAEARPTEQASPVVGTPVVTATATPAFPGAAPNTARVVSRALNVRAGPSTMFPVLVAVSRGTELLVLGQNRSGAWLFVRLESGLEGWVASAYTDYTGSCPYCPKPQATVCDCNAASAIYSGLAWRVLSQR